MSGAQAAVRAAMIDALAGDATLAAALNLVIDGATAQQTPPYVAIGEALSTDWSTKDRAGRELRLALSIVDLAEAPARLAGLATAAEKAIETMPRAIDGWQVAGIALLQSRLLNDAPGRWRALIDYRVRVLADD